MAAFMTREEVIANGARKVIPMFQHMKRIGTLDDEEKQYLGHLLFPTFSFPFQLHHGMFIPAIKGQGNEAQVEKWLEPALKHEIIGTYAQTELGHGTNLRKLETTATYDIKTKEFIINSPTLTSTKWWPGNLGKTVNYAIVVAQLIIKEKNHGVHAFFVQLRDASTHEPLQGVLIGDIGPKFGLNGNDNGFLRFDHFRIPRENMLMKHSKIEEDGAYVAAKNSKLIYGTMIHVRSNMISGQAMALAMAATIAVRYSCIRRQGEKYDGQGESKLLDYQTQQYRLFPEIAKVFAFYFSGVYLQNLYKDITVQIQQGKLNLLPDLHFLSSGLKAYVTYESARGAEICRLSCGGHGFSLSSNLPQIYTTITAGSTYEGDNIVLFLQVARFLLKTVQQKRKGDFVNYLWINNGNTKSPLKNSLTLEDLLDAYEHVARRSVFAAVQEFAELIKQGVSIENAWHQRAIAFSKCAKAHVRVFLVKNFIHILSTIQDAKVQHLMQTLCQLFALHGIYTKCGAFQEDNYIDSQQMTLIKERIFEILGEIRPEAVSIVDGFMFSDRQLDSVLGRYDGNVYPKLYEWAKQSDLNKSDVMPFHHKYLGKIASIKSNL